MDSALESYILRHSEPEPDYLYRLWRATNVMTLHGHMASGHMQGRLLKMLVKMVRPRRVLEVGTFSGYSALCIAEGLSDVAAAEPERLADAHLWTFEVNDEMEEFTRPWIDGSPYADRITFTIGDANVEAPRLGIDFDMVFIDGDKRTYVETYETLLPLLAPGGVMLVDNTLWDGHVVDPQYDRDRQTEGIRRFNEHVSRDSRTEQLILPLRDGLTVIMRRRTLRQ